MSLSLSAAEARRLALGAQGFMVRRPQTCGAKHLCAMVERLGVLQIDSVNAVVRSHYLPLFSRLGDYDRSLLEQLAWGAGRRRRLFEYWGHEASLLPLSLYPLLRWRMRRARDGKGIYKGLARFGREQQPLIRQVLETVRQRGTLGAGSLAEGEKRSGAWWGWSAHKQALEWLFAAGEVTVAGRRGFERLYDLPERVLPAAILAEAEMETAEAQRALLLRALRALGVGTERDLRDYYRLDGGDSRKRLAELVESGAVQPVKIQGWTEPAYCLEGARVPRTTGRSALLSPFDSLVWERARTERIFDFRYRLEIYTPQHKRIFGYYVLPFLHAGRLVARLDVRAERVHRRLAVHAVHEEVMGLDERGVAALSEQLGALAGWLGLERVQLNCTRASGLRLHAHMQADVAVGVDG